MILEQGGGRDQTEAEQCLQKTGAEMQMGSEFFTGTAGPSTTQQLRSREAATSLRMTGGN
jgi:hypothetical protein